MDLKEIDLVDPQIHWYYQSKLKAVKKALRLWGHSFSRIVDVGAGSGFFGLEIIKDLKGVQLICVDLNYPKDYVGDNGVIFQKSSDRCVADVYLLIDVLEHVKDDVKLLNEYVEMAPKGSIFIQTVPAFEFLWSSHDDFLEHERRYNKKGLEIVNSLSGLEVLSSGYLFGTIFPLVFIARKLRSRSKNSSDMKPAPRVVNSILKFVVSLEHKLPLNRCFGLSVMVISKKI